MLMTRNIEVEEPDDELFDYDEPFTDEERQRAWSDILRNAGTGMMSWAEKNFRQKTIEILYHMRYYKDNQTIYLKDSKRS